MKKWVLNNLALKLFSIIVAVGIWLYIHTEITKIVSQKTFESIPVRMLADREELLLANYRVNISPEEINVLLRGEKNQLEKVRRGDLKALVDISDVEGEGIYNLPIKILLPENIELKKRVSPSACQVVIRGFEAPSGTAVPA